MKTSVFAFIYMCDFTAGNSLKAAVIRMDQHLLSNLSEELNNKPSFCVFIRVTPQVLMQYQMTPEMWEEKITAWYAEHRNIAR